MEKNKTGKYLKYAIGEIILVVIGILIALSINNWNEAKKLDTKRQDYYAQLLVDLKKDKKFNTDMIEYFKRSMNEFEGYKEKFSSKNLTPSEVFENLQELNKGSSNLTFNSSTIESLQNSGEIALIPSFLRNKLIDLKRFQEETIKSSNFNNSGKNDMVKRVSLLIGSIEFQNRLYNKPILKKLINRDENLSDIILALEATQKWKEHSQTVSLNYLDTMQKDIEIIIEHINKELK